MTWIVFDYGEVISFAPPRDAGALLPQTVDVEPERFWPAYWARRRPYDLADVSAAEFWDDVCGRLGVPVRDDLLELLVTLDVRSWSHVDPEAVELLHELDGGGARLALLSNAPVEMARAVDGCPWARVFRHRLFSADLRLAKPDPAIYRELLARLEARPDEVVFVDDRAENIRAAEAAGIRGILFTDVAGVRAALAA